MKPDFNTEMPTHCFNTGSDKSPGLHSNRPLPVRIRWLKIPALNLSVWILLVVTLVFTAISSATEITAPDNPKENPATHDTDWPRFRGSNETGISHADTIPLTWTAKDYNWALDLPRHGDGSSVVVGDRLYLMSGEPDTAERIVVCVDVNRDDILWKRSFSSKPHRLHHANSYGSTIPTADANGVVATWSDPEKLLLMALDRKSEKIRWQVKRKTYLVGYATPCVRTTHNGDRELVFLDSADGLAGVDIQTGEVNWQTSRLLPEPPGTVLFVGNSFTFWNQGLWTHMQDLTAARGEGLGAKTSRVVRGGASLRVLWKRTKAKQEIAEGDYDIVVLQEDLPETKVADFHKYAALFDEHTREAGSRLIFFMSWDYQRLNWISMDEIIAEHKRMARELDAEVAPCGYAWQRAMKERPKVDFYSRDREHQSWHGTILNLYVIYSTIYGESPEGLKFTPPEKSEITAEEDAWLRRVAWESVQSWQQQMKEGS
jgi:hypothetical protein